jgi:hypothetical protein
MGRVQEWVFIPTDYVWYYVMYFICLRSSRRLECGMYRVMAPCGWVNGVLPVSGQLNVMDDSCPD